MEEGGRGFGLGEIGLDEGEEEERGALGEREFEVGERFSIVVRFVVVVVVVVVGGSSDDFDR